MFKIIKLFLLICTIQIVVCDDINCDRDIPDESKPGECCYLPTIIPQDMRTQCIKSFGTNNSNGSVSKNLTAELKMAQCIFEKAKATEDDTINEDRVIEVTKSAFAKFNDLEDEFEDAVEKCKKNEMKMLKDFNKKVKVHNFTYDHDVNPVYALYISCIGSRLIGECPDSYKIETKSCSKTRKYLEKCYYQYPYPLFINFNQI